MNSVDLVEIAKDVKAYKLCDCDTIGDQPTCGCDKHQLRLYREYIIHWLGQHWDIECAFKYAIAGLSQSFIIFKYMEDEDVI